ncbi:AEC family transporter, partial [Alcaligenes pakistanensis]
MTTIFPLILPDFLLIALGALLLHRFHFSREFFQGAEKLVYYVLFPALLFDSITRIPLNLGDTWP